MRTQIASTQIILDELSTYRLMKILEKSEKKDSPEIRDMDINNKIEEGRKLLKELFNKEK